MSNERDGNRHAPARKKLRDLARAHPAQADPGAEALRSAQLGATALRRPSRLTGMQNILADHMRNFVNRQVSVQSLSTAAQAERVDLQTANQVLTLLAGWENSSGPTNELRARVNALI